MARTFFAGAAALLLLGCDQSGEGNNVLAEANASGNEASNAVENAVQQLPATSLEKEQALALMEERHENYERIGDAMKVISRELKSQNPDLPQVRQHAATIAQLAPQIPGWFPPGTGPDVGRTEARAEIWQKPEDFAAKAHALNEAAQAFNAAAQGKDVAASRAAHADLGKSCKACHDLDREEH